MHCTEMEGNWRVKKGRGNLCYDKRLAGCFADVNTASRVVRVNLAGCYMLPSLTSEVEVCIIREFPWVPLVPWDSHGNGIH